MKEWWNKCYRNFASEEFKKKVRIQRETFDMILNIVKPYLTKKETNLNQHPISVNRRLGLTLHQLGHGTSFKIFSELFGVSMSLPSVTFNKVCRVLVATLYNRYVKLPRTDEEWEAELKRFLENYEFRCVFAWDCFHEYVSSKMKSYFSFKKRYSMSNLGLVSYNKKLLHCAVGAPGCNHDARMLRNSTVYQKIVTWNAIPDIVIDLGGHGKIPLVTVGDTVFPKHAWLIKVFREDTSDRTEKYFNKKLCSARVVFENAYGMLKGPFCILYKNTEFLLFNLEYIVMASVMLHNLCIDVSDPCLPRWCLHVKNISLIREQVDKREGINLSANLYKISNWL